MRRYKIGDRVRVCLDLEEISLDESGLRRSPAGGTGTVEVVIPINAVAERYDVRMDTGEMSRLLPSYLEPEDLKP